jgi:hypothetical protein
MTKDEEMALRELAAGRCTIQKVVDLVGPLSLWSKEGLEIEIAKAVAAEREACAKVCDDMVLYTGFDCAAAIRARGKN